MSTVEQYRAIFIQQRLYNYVSIVAAIAIVGAVIASIVVDVPGVWIVIGSFVAMYATAVLGARVRTNPLIRCAIENADPELYSNLWKWSVVSGVVTVALFCVNAVLIYQMGVKLPVDLQTYVWISIVQMVMLIGVTVE